MLIFRKIWPILIQNILLNSYRISMNVKRVTIGKSYTISASYPKVEHSNGTIPETTYL